MPPKLPPEIRPILEDITSALLEIVEHGEATEDLTERIETAREIAYDEWQARHVDPYTLGPAPVLVEDVPRLRMRQLREEAGWSQADLAESMTGLGFTWTRATVADIERFYYDDDGEPIEEPNAKSRRLRLTEIYGLAIAFGVPVVTLLLPAEDEEVWLPNGTKKPTQIASKQARELTLGRGGTAGKGGPSWRAAASLAPEGVTRPARALWARRSSKGEDR